MSGQVPGSSPAPRSASTGPNGPLATPTSTTVVNSVGGATGSTVASAATPAAGNPAPLSQSNLNQIVLDYLSKKGYNRAEAVLRAESSGQPIPDLDVRGKDKGAPKYYDHYSKFVDHVNGSLDIYKPELERLLWPFFVYSYLALSAQSYVKEARTFFQKFQERFRGTRNQDLVRLEHITLPEHQEEDNIAKIYNENKYRIVITKAAFQQTVAWFESLPAHGYRLFNDIVSNHLDIREVDRAKDDRYSFEAVLRRGQEGEDHIYEEEGIPGHRPGNAISSTDPSVGNNLATLKLGRMPMEKELEEDVRGDLGDLDLEAPPALGRDTLVETHDKINIKQEDDDEGPARGEIPFPPSTARDVAMEVQKIRENRDRLRLEGRTGGVGPGLSCVMYTFHNSHDNINCMDISGDNSLVAVGTSLSYIKVWSLEGNPIGKDDAGNDVNTKRLIGHGGPVFSVSFQPATVQPPNQIADTSPTWLLSGSMDGKVHLWNLKIWRLIVIYMGHVGPVFSVKFGPMGEYFVSGGSDKLGRLWSTSKASPRRLLAGHDSEIAVVEWHPNSAYVFTASDDYTIRMWSVSNGNAVRMFTGHKSYITAMSCSRNGRLLASGDQGGLIIIWDLNTGRVLKHLRGHGSGGIWSMSFNVECNILVSGAADCTVRAWDIRAPAKEVGSSNANKAAEQGKVDGGASGATTGAGGAGTTGTSASAGGAGGGASGATASSSAAGTGAGGRGKKGKQTGVSQEQISAFLTKKSPVQYANFTNMNLIIAGGSFLPENYPNV